MSDLGDFSKLNFDDPLGLWEELLRSQISVPRDLAELLGESSFLMSEDVSLKSNELLSVLKGFIDSGLGLKESGGFPPV